MKHFYGIFFNRSLLILFILTHSSYYGQSKDIEILFSQNENILNKIFIEEEILNDPFSGIKEYKIELPFSSLNDLDFNEHIEDYPDKSSITLTIEISYSNGVKNKAIGKYEEGQLYSEVVFNPNGCYNEDITYHENGKKASQFYCQKGKIVSPIIEWYKNGMIKHLYDNTGHRTTTKEWYKNGVIARDIVSPYVSDSDYYEKLYYPDGSLNLEGNYNNGRTKYTVYWNNGNILKEGDIYNLSIAKLGKWMEWYKNGKIKLESYYHELNPNIKIGKWKYWNEKGELVREEIYRDNELISTKDYLPLSKKK